jgi:small subunit ribosomal protein S13
MGVTRVRDLEAKPEEKKVEKPKKIEKPKVEAKAIVRVAGTDLDGEKPLIHALRGIKGISYAMSKAVCKVSGFEPNVKLGALTETDIEKLEKIIKSPVEFGIPAYLVNRRKDIETGQNIHLTGSDLDVARKFDIQRYIDIKSYRGWRHMLGQPVRGQRTRSSFRERGRVVGVMRKEIRLQMAKKEESKEKK